MPTIPKAEAVERLAKAMEKASDDDLVEFYAELFPAKGRPDASGGNGAPLAKQLVQHIRAGIEPEEIVDLWNVVFPGDRNVYYDEEDDTLCYSESELRYAEP